MNRFRIIRDHLKGRALPLTALAIIFCTLTVTDSQAQAQDAIASVRLTIDYGDGVQKMFTALPWKEKMMVFDALKAAEKHSHGIKLAYTGRGETIFIIAIDDAANEGANGANWRYMVNDQPAGYSAGVAELKSGDAIVWRFGK
jgi:hypothetical protein